MLRTASGELLGIDLSIHGGLYNLTDASQGIFWEEICYQNADVDSSDYIVPYTLLSDSFEAKIGHVTFSVCFIQVHLQRLRDPPRALHNTPPAMPRSDVLRPAFPSLRLLSRARARIRYAMFSAFPSLFFVVLPRLGPSVSARLL